MGKLGDPYISTEPDLVRAKLEFGEVTAQDTVFDLGCGDARVLVMAALEYGARGVGVELQASVAEVAWSNVAEHDLEELVEIRCEDYRETDLGQANLLILYLTTRTLHTLADKLEELRPGTRVVTHDFALKHWPLSEQSQYISASGESTPLYLYRKL